MDEPEGSYAPQSPDLSGEYQDAYQADSVSPSLPQSGYGRREPYRQDSAPNLTFSSGSKRTADNDAMTESAGSRTRRKTAKTPAKEAPTSEFEIKTKFPVARIKRIMQADEDVGKVAQVTPVAVSKALERFMISLVSRAAQEAQAKGSKRITAEHLKIAVAKDEECDFLQDIISKVPDAPSPDEKGGEEPVEDEPKRRRGRGKAYRALDDL